MWQNFSDFLFSGENIAFLILSIFIISGAVLMISFTKVIHMVTSLAFTFIGLAGVYVLLGAEFIAFVQVLIYAGAITILMIFGIMMTNLKTQEEEPIRPLHNGLLLLGILGFFGILFFSIQKAVFPISEAQLVGDNTKNIGVELFTAHVIPFELVSVLLTVAFIGAIIIAKREEE